MRFLLAALTVFALSGVAQAKVGSNSTRLVASVGPITEDPIPKWADVINDVCNDVRSCDDCAVEKGSALYCKYSDEGQASCCIASKHPKYKKGRLTMIASVGPIVENPIPSWASPSDACSVIGSCDGCPGDDNKYCFYSDNGDATCCKRINADNNSNNSANIDIDIIAVVDLSQPESASPASSSSSLSSSSSSSNNDGRSIDGSSPRRLVASVGPIEEDPIPVWARPTDICTRKRSCDLCSNDNTSKSYCKYTETGIPQCCVSASTDNDGNTNSRNDENNDNDGEDDVLVASVGPITENPIPQWASITDVCIPGSCDTCVQDKSIQYCKFTEEGNQLCCSRQ